jgi:pyridinium-3,5-bisthiocarboxylic acid mononucleotide nickel chelatase
VAWRESPRAKARKETRMTWIVFDCASGISGDMTLGALVDLGVPLSEIEARLRTLPVSGWRISAERTTRNSIAATRVHVELVGEEHEHPHPHEHGHSHRHEHGHSHAPNRNLMDVLEILRGGKLPLRALSWAERVFEILARAEADVHRQPIDKVHFHEVGAVDAIVDIAGVCIGLDWIHEKDHIEGMRVSQLRVGRGQVRTEHGTMPVPAPAVVRLLEKFPVQWSVTDGERVTPTGAAILAALASPLGEARLRLQAAGYGAGERDFADAPNVLRLLLAEPMEAGEAATTAHAGAGIDVAPIRPLSHVGRGRVAVLRTSIDDMVPELFGHLMTRLFAAGALDVQFTPVQMKKSRPGTQVTVIARPGDEETLASVLLDETSTLGVRLAYEERFELERRIAEVQTDFGTVRVKIAVRPGGRSRAIPEYESVRAAAEASGAPIADVYQAALRAAVEALP